MTPEQLFDAQMATWPLARRNYDALGQIRTKQLTVDGFRMRVQFNPARAISSAAKVDTASVAARPCFLCRANRPPEQEGIPVGDYEILVNPFPIFPHHFTIPSVTHQPQLIGGRLCHLMALAWQMPGYTVFYNGARCGASAPDHMHFQAVPGEYLPLWATVDTTTPATGMNLIDGLPFGAVLITTADFAEATRLFDSLCAALPADSDEPEPKINLLCRTLGDLVQIIVIPRRRHRPSVYGPMMISPGTVDMAGVLICPVESDFTAMDEPLARKIFAETGMETSRLRDIITNLH